ncbi:Fur family transcriptional regulator, ferric uptake regulator [Prauserella alba]|uniref:Fur family transcriptional regulator n=1 Tax=Prauserella alba TaxID=176898 RepID=A0ABP4FYW5_9PSEU|nr:Fur family transcriptional regulator, ferric uptake regulator [Prauserella alba]
MSTSTSSSSAGSTATGAEPAKASGTSKAPLPGRRATRQRAAVVELLAEVDDFRSAQELHDELRRRGEGIGLTTVYRTLQSLSDADEIDVLRTDSGEALYRRCSEHHHHHLVCRSCGYTVEVEGPAVERWAETIASGNGFSDISHMIEIMGTCSTCAAQQAS